MTMTKIEASVVTEAQLEGRARRAAKRKGLIATKTRWRSNSVDNYGGFQLVDAWTNTVVDGLHFDLSAERVIEICADEEPYIVSAAAALRPTRGACDGEGVAS